jgi:hypothetical protein
MFGVVFERSAGYLALRDLALRPGPQAAAARVTPAVAGPGQFSKIQSRCIGGRPSWAASSQ